MIYISGPSLKCIKIHVFKYSVKVARVAFCLHLYRKCKSLFDTHVSYLLAKRNGLNDVAEMVDRFILIEFNFSNNLVRSAEIEYIC